MKKKRFLETKIFFALIFFSICISNTAAQETYNTDSLKEKLLHAEEDTNKVNLYKNLVWQYQWSYPDTALTYAFAGLQLSRKLNYEKGEVEILNRMGEAFSQKGNYPKALETELNALKLSEKIKDSVLIGWSISFTGGVYFYSGDYQKALFYFNKQKLYNESFKFPSVVFLAHLGETYFHLGKIDSALFYIQQSFELCIKNKFKWPTPGFYLGAIYSEKRDYPLALQYYKNGLDISKDKIDIIEGYIGMSEVFKKMNLSDSAILYAREAVLLSQKTAIPAKLVESATILIEVYKTRHVTDSVIKYMELMMGAKDNLFTQSKQNLSFNEQLHQQELDNEKEKIQNRIKIYALLGALTTFLLIAIFLFRNNRLKQNAKNKIEKAYKTLENTQAQLIQSEKMASLGELTAGIAHEIQNPLNFVNNFSEVNAELIDEMKEALKAGNTHEALIVADDIRENNIKITGHGKRADAIVKGMLQHSRVSTGQKEPTDINALADKYLRLSYYGFRAKDKSFNATLQTDFDITIGNINIIPQDIGRVLLNLYNNALYALTEKMNQQGEKYEPIVLVSTKKIDEKISISVKDNGIGIPQKVVDKIFQPFFTTKPTGQGTGLGLSLSYDIVKTHGGEINVETKENEGTEFRIMLSLN